MIQANFYFLLTEYILHFYYLPENRLILNLKVASQIEIPIE